MGKFVGVVGGVLGWAKKSRGAWAGVCAYGGGFVGVIGVFLGGKKRGGLALLGWG